ncbi:MAG: endolytic transglycosylase MltG [Nocardioidaceae bacterium]|nr:endolytic transglycosylase MltG [Nocardioidaceae bacterium]NUS52352.1 endolytic transglycosylase MltG [Nocardioidaceae bacterium]
MSDHQPTETRQDVGMGGLGLGGPQPGRRRSHRRRNRPRFGGCLAVLVALAVLLGGGYFAFSYGIEAVKSTLSPPPDYSGQGTGQVLVEVHDGDNATDIAATLKDRDVVKSQDAFISAARKDPKSTGIQVGFYQLRRKMSAENALAVLVDPDNLMHSAVTVPEGLTVEQIVALLAKQTDFSRADYDKVLAHPGQLGLPSYAEGKPEGYLFPATYEVPPNATPRSILASMVKRYDQAVADLDLDKRAQTLGSSPHDVMTVASLVQAEARFDKDFSKVARVIYNRLDDGMPLQFDSTVHYAVGKNGRVGTTDAERATDSPYNTYKNAGLPPTPIGAPGEKAIKAALEPADGSWLYFVTTNPDTGVTKFATSYQQHLRNKAEFDRWCADSGKC